VSRLKKSCSHADDRTTSFRHPVRRFPARFVRSPCARAALRAGYHEVTAAPRRAAPQNHFEGDHWHCWS
jgi:hypothetical protein